MSWKELREISLDGLIMLWPILVMGGIAFALKVFWFGLVFVILAIILIGIAYLGRNDPSSPFQ